MAIKFCHPFVKLIPRGFKTSITNQLICANSCEKVIELLIEDLEPLSFYDEEFSINYSPRLLPPDKLAFYQNIRSKSIQILSLRTHSFSKRLIILGNYLNSLQAQINNQIPYLDLNYEYAIDENFPQFDFETFMAFQTKMLDYLSNSDLSINKFIKSGLDFINRKPTIDLFLKVINNVKGNLTNIDIYYEKIFINHLLFDEFPYPSSSQNRQERYLSFVGTYLFTNYLVNIQMNEKHSDLDFVDIISAIFSFIEHTNFSDIIASIISSLAITSFDSYLA